MVHILSGPLWIPTNVGPGPAQSRQPAGCGASKPAPSAHGSGAAAIDRWMDDKWMDSCHITKIFLDLILS